MRTKRQANTAATLLATAALLAAGVGGIEAQVAAQTAQGEPPGEIELTLERMVDLTLSNSYEVRQLNMDIQRTQLNLKASRARLRSRVDLDFTVPAIDAISETRWDSDVGRYIVQRENSRRFEADLSIRQPLIVPFVGYPTNGYFSLNSRIYQLQQREDGDIDNRYYNRYFVSYTQPLFQANELKNDLEEEELDAERQEYDFYEDVVEMIDNSMEDYFELFEIAYERQIQEAHVERLEEAAGVAQSLAAADPDRQIDIDQISVELANAREDLTSNDSRFRFETSSLKTEFNIPAETVITIDPVIELARVPIDVEQATRFALEQAPRMRQMQINHRENEIDLDNTKGRGGFELDVSLSWGREMQNEIFGDLWREPENSYTVDVEGSIPIWDWGEREAEIDAEEIGLQQSLLRIEEATADIRNQVQNEVRNVAEYEDRAFNMQSNMELSAGITATNMQRYEAGQISVLDLLQSLNRQVDTAENFLEAYIGWREALQSMQEMTYYDFERESFLLDRFGISYEEGIGNRATTTNVDAGLGGG